MQSKQMRFFDHNPRSMQLVQLIFIDSISSLLSFSYLITEHYCAAFLLFDQTDSRECI